MDIDRIKKKKHTGVNEWGKKKKKTNRDQQLCTSLVCLIHSHNKCAQGILIITVQMGKLRFCFLPQSTTLHEGTSPEPIHAG